MLYVDADSHRELNKNHKKSTGCQMLPKNPVLRTFTHQILKNSNGGLVDSGSVTTPPLKIGPQTIQPKTQPNRRPKRQKTLAFHRGKHGKASMTWNWMEGHLHSHPLGHFPGKEINVSKMEHHGNTYDTLPETNSQSP